MGIDSTEYKSLDVQQYAKQVLEIRPDITEDQAVMALSAHEFNVQATIESLLQGEKPGAEWSDVHTRRQKVCFVLFISIAPVSHPCGPTPRANCRASCSNP
jgi:hypothetical protein